ncbi:A disintegrin and metalloproteinase with thrombospondin motifs 7 [Nerophis lumbriciformis]|uniref:A disintegrin and metalloproteinase with thrombospondin motifs 7 n=1 Tax=Nerophis lumbriciformis TaxID=546530 RepID=UPI003BA9290D
MDCGLHLHFFFLAGLLVAALQNCRALGSPRQPERFHQDLPQYEVVHPTRVDVRGHFLSNFLSHRSRRVQRRDASEESLDQERVFYQFWHGGRSLHFHLNLNPKLLASGFLTERRYGGLKGAKIRPPGASLCHFLGEVWDEAAVKGSAAISTCDGLTGLFKLSDEEFFIQPLEKLHDEPSAPQAHAIYKRHTPSLPRSPVVESISGIQSVNASCGVQNSHHSLDKAERQREYWEQNQQRRRRRIHRRSVSKEKWVETLVVADPKMVEYHGSKSVESYVLAVMNIVAGIFQDASIGNTINIVVVRLILLEQDEDDLKITHHADNSLSSFCKWQKRLNLKGDDHYLHHDVAVLLTRKDICASINMPCETLGLSHVAGMCQSHRSCSISEDTGLPLAFTVAHELGHNFGIQHDGNGNDCEPIGKRPFIMSPQLLYGTSLPRWSRCSRQYITRFLDRGWGWCLDDAPVKDSMSQGFLLPGALYSAAHQCRLQYGSGSMLCDDMDNVCSTLWCTVGNTCHSKLDGAVDGTSCGEDKWCFSGECVAAGHHPDSVNGGWGSWTEWTACSRSCGAGIVSAQRDCDDPIPKNRGKYCLGERQRYRICNTSPCQNNAPSFRDIQCSHFNSAPYKGTFYNWVAVISKVSPCELHCRPLNEHFSEKMRDAVIDGTPCLEGNKSRNMCVNGICKNIGCDYIIESSAVEDRCGICQGNGSTCTTIRKTFEESQGLGYVDIGLIPEGSWDIRIEEMAEAGNFLALRSDNPNKYYLNGGWTIQWNGEYKAAGTVFTYERTGHLENLTSPGPTMEPLWIQLLFQETNPGVRYEYTVSRNVSEDDIFTSVFFWKFGSWTECSVTCGAGVQRQIVHCVERTNGIVEESLCDPLTRPDDNQTTCNKELCPAIWWVGEWHACSASCGSSGMAKRTVLCIQAISVEEQKALQPSECEHIPKPESVSSCSTHIPCPADWTTGSWTKCSQTCGSGVRRRNVTCSRNTGVDCDLLKKPHSLSTCNIQDCPLVVDNFGDIDWSGSGWTSSFNEIHSVPKPPAKHSPSKLQPKNPNDSNNIFEDFHYHNRIDSEEDSLEKSLKVDDFYYDYNFINFHEDLSDESDGTVSKDSQEMGFQEEDEPPHSGKGSSPLIPAEPLIIDLNNVKNSGNTGTKEPTQIHSEWFDDYLFEDYLLPVSTTQSPPSSTEHSSVLEERYDNLRGFENFSTGTPQEVTSRQPAKRENIEHDREQDENNRDSSGEENHTEKFTTTPSHAASTLGLHAENSHTVTQTMSTREKDDLRLQKTYTTTPYYPPSFMSPSIPGTERSQIKTTLHAVQREENRLKLPDIQINNKSTVFSPALILEELDPSPHNTDVIAIKDDSPGLSHHGLNTTSLLSPESSTLPFLSPDLPMPSNQNVPDDTILSTGREFIRPTIQEEYSQPWPNYFDQTTAEPTPSKPVLADPFFILDDYDYNEVTIPPVVRSDVGTDSSTSPSPQAMTTQAASVLPSQNRHFWPLPLTTSSPAQVTSYWVTGNWSPCSTSCGLGAIWRTLACSTGSESNCDPAKRPTPAQRCYLRPCSIWKIGEWTKCTKSCGVGVKSREVQCFDMRDHRPLRPFHCRAMSSRPQSHVPCNLQPCLDWYTSSWGQCSEVCGGGGQQRIVTCPVKDHCDVALQPSNTRRCNTRPCAQWLKGLWEQCSASCGSGVQHRLVKCVNTKTETEEEVDQAQCDHEPHPETMQKCNLKECLSAPSGASCLRDRLTSRFCQTLHWLGRCQLPNVRAQCCKTCKQPPAAGPGSTAHQ